MTSYSFLFIDTGTADNATDQVIRLTEAEKFAKRLMAPMDLERASGNHFVAGRLQVKKRDRGSPPGGGTMTCRSVHDDDDLTPARGIIVGTFMGSTLWLAILTWWLLL
jgi:hypothetical protein